MKLDTLLFQLEHLRIRCEEEDFAMFPDNYRDKLIIELLVAFINHKKVEEKVDEISF